MGPSEAQSDVVVSLDPGMPLGDALRRLRAAGLEVTRTLDEIGVVCGSVAESRIPALQSLPGVESVELARSVQLPPPESPRQ